MAAAWYLKSSTRPHLAMGVLQASWIESGQSAPESAVWLMPEPEIAPQPLPVRPQPVARPRQGKPAPVLAVRSDTSAGEGHRFVAEEENAPDAPVATISSLSEENAGVAETSAAAGESNMEITPPRFGAAYLSNPEPEYPPLSRRLYEQGLVTLYIHITPEGKADKVALHKTSGFERLDKAASDVVWRWRFIPARRGQENVAGWVMVPIRFNLRS